MLLVMMFGCSGGDPAAVAVQACELLPGLSATASDLALLEPLLSVAEGEALRSAALTEGRALIDDAAMASLRAATTCTAGEVNSAGGGRWAVELTRTGPMLDAAGQPGEPVEKTMTWQVVREDTLRVETGLITAELMRKSAEDAVAEDDLRKSASLWRAIAERYPDPVLAVDVAAAARAEAEHAYIRALKVRFVSVKDGMLLGEITNSNRDITDLSVEVIFDINGERSPVPVSIAALAAGQKAEVRAAIPEGAGDKVSIEARSLHL